MAQPQKHPQSEFAYDFLLVILLTFDLSHTVSE